jgi:clan AA aspartic protease
MMSGYVEDNRAILPVEMQTVLGSITGHFFIDTGFEGFLTLRPHQIAALGFTYFDETEIKLAEGTPVKTGVYNGVINWHGEGVNTFIIALDSMPLLGSEFLRGCHVCIDFEEGGLVTVEQNPLS